MAPTSMTKCLEVYWCTNCQLVNNLCRNDGQGLHKLAIFIRGELAEFPNSFDFNDYYCPQGSVMCYVPGYTELYLTLPQAQHILGLDRHSWVADPRFQNISLPSADLHLQANSPAIGRGLPLAEVPVDIDGQPRPSTHTCTGCDEVVPANFPTDNLPALQADFAMACFPNPFNPTTTLSYELQASSHVSLKVYDTTGRLVQTLADGWREAGEHQVTFDGSNLPSGIYLFSLVAGDNSATGKMVLLK
jgi:hypothetical protein